MESISSCNISEETENVEAFLHTNNHNESEKNSMKVSPNDKDEKRRSFQIKLEERLSGKVNQKKMMLALEQEKLMKKLYESKNNILKSALNKLNALDNPNRITNIKSAQNLVISNFNSNKSNSVLNKVQNINMKKTLTKNKFISVNPLDVEEILNKELTSNEMKSEVNLLNIETKSLHTPKELEQENLKNFDFDLINGAESYNYIETENGEVLLYPENTIESNKSPTIDILNTINTISNTEEIIRNTSPKNRNKNRKINNSSLNSDTSYFKSYQTTSYKNKNQAKSNKMNENINNQSVMKNKKKLNNSCLPIKSYNKSKQERSQKNTNKNIEGPKMSSRFNDTKKTLLNNTINAKNYNSNKDKNPINCKTLRISQPKNIGNSKKIAPSLHSTSTTSKTVSSVLTENNKYNDILSILDNIFGENLENYNEKGLNSVLETFEIKNLTKAFINCIYKQRERIRDLEEKETNVHELNNQISMLDKQLKELTKDKELKTKKKTSSTTPNKNLLLNEEYFTSSKISNINRLNNCKFTPKNVNDGNLTDRKILKKKLLK